MGAEVQFGTRTMIDNLIDDFQALTPALQGVTMVAGFAIVYAIYLIFFGRTDG
jgi:hypothetical protein